MARELSDDRGTTFALEAAPAPTLQEHLDDLHEELSGRPPSFDGHRCHRRYGDSHCPRAHEHRTPVREIGRRPGTRPGPRDHIGDDQPGGGWRGLHLAEGTARYH